MSSRADILTKVLQHQPEWQSLPDDLTTQFPVGDPIGAFKNVLTNIGGAFIEVTDYASVQNYIIQHYSSQRIITTIPELKAIAEYGWENQDPHTYSDVELAVIKAHFGVAENAALWITEELMHQRAVPFICQQLAVVVRKKNIVQTMHDAYLKIGEDDYGFGSFIAGPSKTADIEQSLVLGAHGPKGMTVFVLTDDY